MTIFVTGGAGFIGSNFILNWIKTHREKIINLDKLTYASNLKNLKKIEYDSRYVFIKGDINNNNLVSNIFDKFNPRSLIHFAAESHVDRSISSAKNFIRTNILGTYNLLEVTRNKWEKYRENEKNKFRFIHISTDEVYGSLEKDEDSFRETNQFKPNSPYSASKASSNHLVRSFHKTFGLPVITTNCSNNYGPFQNEEKFIPMIIQNALNNKDIPIYGDGTQIRDWLYVVDHCNAINKIMKYGKIGEVYNIGGMKEIRNIDLAMKICEILDQLIPPKNKISYKEQILFVRDRLGHDKRYAINCEKLKKEIGWFPKENFETNLIKTIKWTLKNL